MSNYYTRERRKAELDALAELMRRRYGRTASISTESVFDSLDSRLARERLGQGQRPRHGPAQREEWEVA